MTIRELAKQCGLSVSAVSKALNGYPDISEETRARVLAVAQEMGYYPNSLARGLKTNRTYNLAIVLDESLGVGLSLLHNHFMVILDAFRKEAAFAGYDITLISHTFGGQAAMSYLNHCRQRNVDGICLMCVNFSHPEIIELSQCDLPLISIDHPFEGRDCVLSDNQVGMRSLVQYALAMGHRRVAYIHGQPSIVTNARMESYRAAMGEAGLQCPNEYLVPSNYRSIQHTIEGVNRLLSLPQRPTCILMSDDYSALSGIRVIGELGLRIPQNISVAGYDGEEMIQKIRPKLTTYAQNGAEMGRLAALRLIERIMQPDLPVQRDAVYGTLIKGETIGRPPADC